jgi:hypothetical protein
MKSKTLILLFISGLLFSCKQPQSPKDLFKTTKNLKAEIIEIKEELLGMPSYDMVLIDSLILVKDRKAANEKCLFVIDVKNRIIVDKIITKGWGPCEFSIIQSLTLSMNRKNVYFQENNKRSIYTINREVLESETKCPELLTKLYDYEGNESNYKSICQILSGNFVGLGPMNDSCMYSIFNAKGKRLASAYNFPEAGNNKKFSQELIARMHYGVIKANPEQDLAACILYYSGFLEIIKINDTKIESSKRIELQMPKCTFVSDGHGGTRLLKDRTGIVGNLLLDTNKDYIYVAYSENTIQEPGGSYAKYIQLYDWKGNPVKQYELDHPVIAMAVSQAGDFIYGISENPYPIIVKYTLK